MTWQRKTIGAVTALVLLVVVSLLLSTKASPMLKLCLFSPVKGIVVHKGVPVVGAVIERSWKWNWRGQEKEGDHTVTNGNGEFEFSGIYSWLGIVQFVPHEPVIHQQIIIKYDGATYNAWSHFKHEYGEFAELDIAKALGEGPGLEGKPIDLICDLDETVKPRGGYGGIAVLR